MGKQIPAGTPNQIAHITQASLAAGDNPNVFRFSEDVTEAHIEFMPAAPQVGLTIVLPGPNAVPISQPPGSGPRPNDGDVYKIRDPRGLVSGAHNLVIDGGGYSLGVSGNLGASVNVGAVAQTPFVGVEFTFNAELQLWVGCVCGNFSFIT